MEEKTSCWLKYNQRNSWCRAKYPEISVGWSSNLTFRETQLTKTRFKVGVIVNGNREMGWRSKVKGHDTANALIPRAIPSILTFSTIEMCSSSFKSDWKVTSNICLHFIKFLKSLSLLKIIIASCTSKFIIYCNFLTFNIAHIYACRIQK